MSITFSNKLAEVKTEIVSVAGQQIADKVAVSVRDDEGNFIPQAILSSGYNLIPNGRAIDIIQDIFSRSGYIWRPLKTVWNGKSLLDHFITESQIAVIENGQAHPIHLGAMLRNSYDGSTAFGFDIFLCNLQCANQYVSKNLFGSFLIRHVAGMEYNLEDAVGNIALGVSNALKVIPQISNLQNTMLDLPAISEAKKQTLIPQTKWGSVLDELIKQPATMYGLFQALTYVSTHECTGMSALKIGNSITDHFIKS